MGPLSLETFPRFVTCPSEPAPMNEVTRILSRIESGEAGAAGLLLPLVYDELRQLARSKLTHERPGQTLQATALVHEAFVRLVAGEGEPSHWDGRGHFFAAAAEAMRRILVESARRKRRLRHGGDLVRVNLAPHDLDELEIAAPQPREDLLALDAALDKLKQVDGTASQLVQLRYFAGLTQAEAAEMLDISTRTADRIWAYARAWLHREVQPADPQE